MDRAFFSKMFKDFNYKLALVLSMVLYPFLLLYLTPFSIYDGLRHVLWMIPYLCIIPALAIYLLKNIRYLKIKLISGIMFLLISYFSFNFFYNYTLSIYIPKYFEWKKKITIINLKMITGVDQLKN